MQNRTLSPKIIEGMKKYPVVTLIGPRQSGKTTLARELFPDFDYVNLEDLATRAFAKEDPSGFFKAHKAPVIIDEIQNCPELVSRIQVESDKLQNPGQFLITGSQQIALLSAVTQSLAGRTAIYTLLPFSVSELKSYKRTFTREERILKGGLPRLHQMQIDPAEYYRDYIRTYLERDMRQILNIKNLGKFELFLRLLAGRCGQLVNLNSLSGDVGVSSTTLAEWLTVLETSFIIFRLNPWFGNIGKRLTKSSKIYFLDTGIACSLLGIETKEQLERDPLRGNLFENFVIVEKLKSLYNANKNPSIYFFRTEVGVEIDLIEQDGCSLIPWEIKSSDTVNDEYFKNLEKLEKYFSKSERIKPGTGAQKGGLIYSGSTIPEYKGWRILNFEEME